jgi:hypothetical protein
MCIGNKRLTDIRPGASVENPIVIDYNETHRDDQEFVQGSSTGGGGLVLLGHVNLCTSPPPKMRDREFFNGSSTLGPVFLGRIDLCTPSPSP